MNIFKHGLEGRAQAELQINQKLVIEIKFSLLNLLMLIGALQLALRHPLFKEARGSKTVRQFIYSVKGLFAKVPMPALCEVVDRGFDETYDWEPGQEEN